MEKIDYWTKIKDTKAYDDLAWNIPEQKVGTINIIGGHAGGFHAPVQATEYLLRNYPIKTLNLLLPDSLRNKLPPTQETIFLPSTESGSLAKSPLLTDYLSSADFTIVIGDLSKNSSTEIALSDAIRNSDKPIILTRDSIDLLLPDMTTLIEKEDLFIVGSLAQIQKLFRSVYYPKLILLSITILPIIEALHKFTLTYPTTILTFHNEQVIVASSGSVVSIPLENTSYSGNPISLWNGDLSCKIAALNLYNPHKKIEATTLALSSQNL